MLSLRLVVVSVRNRSFCVCRDCNELRATTTLLRVWVFKAQRREILISGNICILLSRLFDNHRLFTPGKLQVLFLLRFHGHALFQNSRLFDKYIRQKIQECVDIIAPRLALTTPVGLPLTRSIPSSPHRCSADHARLNCHGSTCK